MQALAEGGLAAVKVDRLAQQLKITRGSFYWHFKSRDELLEAMLDFWENELTGELIQHASELPDPASRLRAVAAEAIERESHGLPVERVEESLRSWASQDERAARRMHQIDHVRVDYIAHELEALGYAGERARRLARVLYLALIGLFAARGYNPALADNQAYADLVELVVADVPASR